MDPSTRIDLHQRHLCGRRQATRVLRARRCAHSDSAGRHIALTACRPRISVPGPTWPPSDTPCPSAAECRAALVCRSVSDIDPSYRFRTIRPVPELFRQFPKPTFPAVCLDTFERHSVYSRCALVGAAAGIGILKYVYPVNLVIQCMEPELGFFLRFCM